MFQMGYESTLEATSLPCKELAAFLGSMDDEPMDVSDGPTGISGSPYRLRLTSTAKSPVQEDRPVERAKVHRGSGRVNNAFVLVPDLARRRPQTEEELLREEMNSAGVARGRLREYERLLAKLERLMWGE